MAAKSKQPNADDQYADSADEALGGGFDSEQIAAEMAAAGEAAGPAADAAGAVGDAALQQELSAARDRALRLQAEMENLRGRTARELADAHRYAALPIVRDLLPVVDNVDRAIEAAEKDAGSGNLLDGFRLVRQQLATVLSRHQCEPIEADRQPFDPQFHEAILQQPSDDVPAQHVMMVTQSGYKMHDRVVRPAQVIVSSGPAG
ncbi:MAG: nucleotide exchange factor GrpE [Planctomycetales bacterium]|nr:nucleotide exchange factor GrpE [Planctomycetales bacterium]